MTLARCRQLHACWELPAKRELLQAGEGQQLQIVLRADTSVIAILTPCAFGIDAKGLQIGEPVQIVHMFSIADFNSEMPQRLKGHHRRQEMAI